MRDQGPRRVRAVALAVMAALLATCSGGAPAPPGGSGHAASGEPAVSRSPAASDPTTSTALVSAAASIPPTGTTPPSAAIASPEPDLPASPPTALLVMPDGQPAVTGSLGSYTWGGSGSDAPWLPGAPAGTLASGTSLRVAFDGVAAATWTAGWAPLNNGVAGEPADGGSGSGQVSVTTPAGDGDWSLRVTATFGPGANATWFWRVAVAS